MYITEILNNKSVDDKLRIASWLDNKVNHYKVLATCNGKQSRANIWYFLTNYSFDASRCMFRCYEPASNQKITTISLPLTNQDVQVRWSNSVAAHVSKVFDGIITNGLIFDNEYQQLRECEETRRKMTDLGFCKKVSPYSIAGSGVAGGLVAGRIKELEFLREKANPKYLNPFDKKGC